MQELTNREKHGSLKESKRPSIIEALESPYISKYASRKSSNVYFKDFFHEGLKYCIIPNIYGKRVYEIFSQNNYASGNEKAYVNLYKNIKSDIVIVNVGKEYPSSIKFHSLKKNFKRFGFSFLIDIPKEKNDGTKQPFFSLYAEYFKNKYSKSVRKTEFIKNLENETNKQFNIFFEKNSDTIWLPAFFYFEGVVTEPFTQLTGNNFTYFNSSSTPLTYSFYALNQNEKLFKIRFSEFSVGELNETRKKDLMRNFFSLYVSSDRHVLTEYRYTFTSFEFPYSNKFVIALKSRAFKATPGEGFYQEYDKPVPYKKRGDSHDYIKINDIYYVITYTNGLKHYDISTLNDLMLLKQSLTTYEYNEFVVPNLDKFRIFLENGETGETKKKRPLEKGEDIDPKKKRIGSGIDGDGLVTYSDSDSDNDDDDIGDNDDNKNRTFTINVIRTYVKFISIIHEDASGAIFSSVSNILNLNQFTYTRNEEDASFYNNLTKKNFSDTDVKKEYILKASFDTRNPKEQKLVLYGNQYLPGYLIKNIVKLRKKIDDRKYKYLNIDKLNFGIESRRKIIRDNVITSSYMVDLTYNYEYLSIIISLIISSQIKLSAFPAEFYFSYINVIQTNLMGIIEKEKLIIYKKALIEYFKKVKKGKTEPVFSNSADKIHRRIILEIYSILHTQLPFKQKLISDIVISDYSRMIDDIFIQKYKKKEFISMIQFFTRSIFLLRTEFQ